MVVLRLMRAWGLIIWDVVSFSGRGSGFLEKIIELEIKDVESRLKDQRILIDLTKEAKDFLIDRGFDKVFGARPLKRTIQRFLEDPLAEEIIKGNYKNGAKVRATAKGDHLEFVIV